MGTVTFTSPFIKKTIQEDVRHVDPFLIMGDVHVAFGILTRCFVQCPSYLLRYTSPSSTFTESFISFDYSLHKMFGHLFGLRSFHSPKGFLACKQASLSITFNGIGLILTSTIAPIAYLRNWALITVVIVIRFMVDQCPFLLEVLTQIDNNTSRQHVIFYNP